MLVEVWVVQQGAITCTGCGRRRHRHRRVLLLLLLVMLVQGLLWFQLVRVVQHGLVVVVVEVVVVRRCRRHGHGLLLHTPLLHHLAGGGPGCTHRFWVPKVKAGRGCTACPAAEPDGESRPVPIPHRGRGC